MTSAIKDLDAALDAALDLAIRIRRSLSDASPGGKKITIDELLDGVTDGKLTKSLRDLVDAVEATIAGHGPGVWELLPKVGAAAMELMGHLRDALADGRITLDDIVQGVSDGHVREGLANAVAAAQRLPSELDQLSPWALIGTIQRVIGRLHDFATGR